jgi:hypothetical protein
MRINPLPPVHLLRLPDAEALNAALLQQFLACHQDPDVHKTHFVQGRFENLYIERERTPAILPLIAAAERAAGEILRRPGPLRCGHWFNLMGPGHRTSLHSHEENDELLSAVYYLRIPERSGDLVLQEPPVRIRVRPAEGLMVLFPPWLPHAVERNESTQDRLSVAFNFGPG